MDLLSANQPLGRGQWQVLFRDLSGFWAPLQHLYWSSSSYGAVCRHPRSSVQEVESAYCPQCLTLYSEEEASGRRQGRCSQCRRCVSCNAPFADKTVANSNSSNNNSIPAPQEGQWECLECGLVGPSTGTRAAAEDSVDSHMKAIISYWNSTLGSGQKGKLLDRVNSRHNSDLLFPLYSDNSNSNLNWLGNGDEGNAGAGPVRLRGKRVVRCRKDMDEFAENILLKRKHLPLDGDSSKMALVGGSKGRWFLKDQFAVKELPSIYLIMESENSGDNIGDNSDMIIVRLVNPLASSINVKLDISYGKPMNQSTGNIVATAIKVFDDAKRTVERLICIPPASNISKSIMMFTMASAEESGSSTAAPAAQSKGYVPGKSLRSQSTVLSGEVREEGGCLIYRNIVEFSLYFPRASSAADAAAALQSNGSGALCVDIDMTIANGQHKYDAQAKLCYAP